MITIIKTIISSILILAFQLGFANNKSPQLNFQNSLLWEISGKNLKKPSYLYGTMHAVCNNTGIEKLKVQKAIASSSQLYLELDMDNPNLVNIKNKLYNDEVKIKDLENLESRDKLLNLSSKLFKINRSIIEQINLYRLNAILTVKGITQCSIPKSVEKGLINIFKRNNKQIHGLESLEEQFGFIKDSGIINLESLIITIENFDQVIELYNQISFFYRDENIDNIYALMTTPTELLTQEYIQKMMSLNVNKRNINWVNIIPEIANTKATFFAVGVGHLGGEHGVIQLLKNQGYIVEAVTD